MTTPARLISVQQAMDAPLPESVRWTAADFQNALLDNMYLFYGFPISKDGAKLNPKSYIHMHTFRGAKRAMNKGIYFLPEARASGFPKHLQQVIYQSPEALAALKISGQSAEELWANIYDYIINKSIRQDNFEGDKSAVYQAELNKYADGGALPTGIQAEWAKRMQVRDNNQYWIAIRALAQAAVIASEKGGLTFAKGQSKVRLTDQQKIARLINRYNEMPKDYVLDAAKVRDRFVGIGGAPAPLFDKKGKMFRKNVFYDSDYRLVVPNVETYSDLLAIFAPGLSDLDRQARLQQAKAYLADDANRDDRERVSSRKKKEPKPVKLRNVTRTSPYAGVPRTQVPALAAARAEEKKEAKLKRKAERERKRAEKAAEKEEKAAERAAGKTSGKKKSTGRKKKASTKPSAETTKTKGAPGKFAAPIGGKKGRKKAATETAAPAVAQMPPPAAAYQPFPVAPTQAFQGFAPVPAQTFQAPAQTFQAFTPQEAARTPGGRRITLGSPAIGSTPLSPRSIARRGAASPPQQTQLPQTQFQQPASQGLGGFQSLSPGRRVQSLNLAPQSTNLAPNQFATGLPGVPAPVPSVGGPAPSGMPPLSTFTGF